MDRVKADHMRNLAVLVEDRHAGSQNIFPVFRLLHNRRIFLFFQNSRSHRWLENSHFLQFPHGLSDNLFFFQTKVPLIGIADPQDDSFSVRQRNVIFIVHDLK